jgi:glycine C-acetyltransferase
MVMVDDSHAIGFIGDTGAGTPEMFGVRDRVDLVAGTLGKALGGASGGYISGHQEIVDLLRQRARPYLFSNSIPPTVVAGSLVALDLVSRGAAARATLRDNAKRFRDKMSEAGFTLLPGEHPIVPVMFADEHEAVRMASALFDLGIYVVAFSYPVVPMGKARIRVQVCANHSTDDIDICVAAFIAARGLRDS